MLGPDTTPATLDVACLASGSSGNAMLVRCGDAALLVDAGISAARLAAGLRLHGVEPHSLDGVLVTHEHGDHIAGLRVFSRKYRTPVYCTDGTRTELSTIVPAAEYRALSPGSSLTVGGFDVAAFPVSHDAAAPVGFVVSARGASVTIATDLGRPTPEVAEAVRMSDLVVLEANHDLGWLLAGPYPRHLKRRISGGTGHLANLDAAGLIAGGLGGRPQTFWLAHLSCTNNTPERALVEVGGFLEEQGLAATLHVAGRDGPSLTWSG